MCDKVHGTGSAASTKAQLDQRLGFFTKIQCGSTLRKCHQGHGVRFIPCPGTLFLSPCKENWSTPPEPATTEMLVFVYSNSTMMTVTRDAD